MPMWRRRMRASSSSLFPVIVSPAMLISPSSATSSPAMRLSSVDFPQPDGPMIATNSPAATSRSTPRRRAPARARLRTSCAHRPPGTRIAPPDFLTSRLSPMSPLSLCCSFGSCRRHGRFAREPEREHRRLPSLDLLRLQRLERRRVRQRRDGRVGQYRRARRARPVLQALREIHRVADERVLEPLLGTQQRGRDLARRQADAETERLQRSLLPTARRAPAGSRASSSRPRARRSA